ncbi:Multidrug export protein MepA [Jeotgalibaca dankookensis]|uniref:Multidrug export protein MepA n=1 Tax=Jeotgalibaca dankookensis TaxID=708126 RepID=A0A1S6IRY8_9LACT|nr:MATE family efflux transporter [Jeotgalibaca dankookensis]AQS54317.1 Multidrug export protein MepA [Jeotgalibaca dankookensis]
MNKGESSRMGTEKVPRLMLQLAAPSVLAQLINILYNIVDRMYIGHIPNVGAMALTGLGISAPLVLIIAAFSLFVGGGGAPLAAIALGRNDKAEAEKILSNGATLLTLMAIILTVVFLIIKEPLLYLFGASEITFPYANEYSSIYIMGTLFVQYALGLNLFITSQGKTRRAMLAVLIGALSNIVLDPIFIFGFGMGVSGAAIATVISQALSALYVVRFLTSDRSTIRIRKKYLKPDWALIKRIISLGVSPFVMQATESAIVVVFNNGLLKFGGDLYVGSMAIMQSVMQLLTVPVSGFTQGVQPIISYNFGAEKYDRVRETVRYALIITVATTASYFLLVLLGPGIFAKVFTSDKELLNLVSGLLPIYMGGMWLFGVQMSAQMYFVGTGQAKKSLFIALLRKVIILIPLALFLPRFFGVMGIYYAEPIADMTSATTAGFLLYFTIKNLPKDISNKPIS